MRGLTSALVLSVAAILALAPAAHGSLSQPFDGAPDITCTDEADGDRICGGEVITFDGQTALDVNVGIPGGGGPSPMIMEFHGWNGSKLDDYGIWMDRGYAYFSISDRGWGGSCSKAGDLADLLLPQCDEGYNHLMDTRFEVRDAQYMAGLLVDDGVARPGKIGAFGGSYGGGLSMALAALRNRVMMPNGNLVPWESPDGVKISLAAAQPDIPWSDLAYSLVPTGRTLDYVADAPYEPGKIGVMKESFVGGLYATGQANSNYATPPDEPDINGWYARLNAGEPYDGDPLAESIVDEVTAFHSSYYIDDSVRPAPLLISNGFTDDLFPPDEAIRFYNRTRDSYPGAKVSLFFSDHGHQRGQNKSADVERRESRRDAFFDHYLKGEGPEPGTGVETLTQVCDGPSGGPFPAETWRELAPGEIRFSGEAAKTVAPGAADPAGSAYDPITGPGACATAPAADQPGLANYRLDPAPAGGFTLMGSPTIIADIGNPGPSSYLAGRLVDVDPATDEQTLVARGLLRPKTTTLGKPKRQVFQLHPNGYEFAAGHVAKLELLPADKPYSRPANGQRQIGVSKLELRLPVLEQPGTAGAQAPAPKFVPEGYELAPGYPAAQVDGDGDGVADGEDECPGDPGTGADGCPGGGGGGGSASGRCANRIAGTNGKDQIRGTKGGDRIVARRGRDRVRSLAGRDCLLGQAGTDTLKAGRGADKAKGGRGPDHIKSARGSDRVNGNKGADRIVPGKGRDQVNAGRGRDKIRSKDGRRDVVRCGKGRDRVKADRKDKLRGCERRF